MNTIIINLEESVLKEKSGTIYGAILKAVEKPLIEYILDENEGNQLKTARILGINRNTLRTKIRKLGIQMEKR